ncbi:MFS transporter [Streptomyces sp. NPDC003036]|uniref:MFS transporter n=1 Tax=Streptomyces sp. NPDC003036 TaxID=3154442 RepID=UPI0033B406C0
MNARRHRRLILTGSVTGAAIVALDGTVLTVAQPSLGRDLHASFTQVQWTSTGYLIAVASLLVFAGRLGDRYGHQRLFAVGILGFGAASAGIGLAPGVGWVIALRVVQGVFGALLQPATLGMLRAAYPPDRIGRPLGLRTAAIGLAAAAGPVVGGVLTTQFGWRAVFLINVVPAVVIGVAALAVRLPEPGPRRAVGLDLPGACLLALTLVCLVHTLIGIPAAGWTAATTLGLVAAAACGGAFLLRERRTESPLLPPEVLGSATVATSLAVLLAASASLFGTLFAGTYLLQEVLAMDPLGSGLTALPLAVMMVLSAAVADRLLRRHGPRRTTVAAMALVALGALALSWLALSGADSGSAAGGGFLLLGAGFGTVMVTATAVLVRHVPVAYAGVAGGLQQTAMNVGPALGVAVATMAMALTAPGTGAPRSPWAAEGFPSAIGVTLAVLAAVAAAGALCATALPARGSASDGPGRGGRTDSHDDSHADGHSGSRAADRAADRASVGCELGSGAAERR